MRLPFLALLVLAVLPVRAAEAPPPIEAPKEIGKVEPHLPPPETNDPENPTKAEPARPGDCRIGNTEIDGRRTMVLLCMEADGRWHMRGEIR
jgi:hypothetical protein